jgi:hypothetical protein
MGSAARMMMMSAAVRPAARSIERVRPSAIVPPPARAGRNSDRAECGIANVNLMTPGPARRRAGGGTESGVARPSRNISGHRDT